MIINLEYRDGTLVQVNTLSHWRWDTSTTYRIKPWVTWKEIRKWNASEAAKIAHRKITKERTYHGCHSRIS